MIKEQSLYDVCFTCHEDKDAIVIPKWSNVIHAFCNDEVSVLQEIQNQYLNRYVEQLIADKDHIELNLETYIYSLIYYNDEIELLVYEKYAKAFKYQFNLEKGTLGWDKVQVLLKLKALEYGEETIGSLYRYSSNSDIEFNIISGSILDLFGESEGFSTDSISDFVIMFLDNDEIKLEHKKKLLDDFFERVNPDELVTYIKSFLEQEELEFTFKEHIVKNQNFKFDELPISDFLEKNEDDEVVNSLFTVFFAHNRIAPNWDNIDKYVSEEYCQRDVLQRYIAGRAKILINLEGKINRPKFIKDFIIHNDYFSLDDYQSILDSFSVNARYIDYVDVDLGFEKVLFLVKNEKLQISSRNIEVASVLDDKYPQVFLSWLLTGVIPSGAKSFILDFLKSGNAILDDTSKVELLLHCHDLFNRDEIISIIQTFENKPFISAVTERRGKSPTIKDDKINNLADILPVLKNKRLISSFSQQASNSFKINQFKS